MSNALYFLGVFIICIGIVKFIIWLIARGRK